MTDKAMSEWILEFRDEYEIAKADYEILGNIAERLSDIAEKETPKKPVKDKENPRYGMGNEYYDWMCPTCERFLAPEPAFEKIPDRCPKCNQKLIKLTRKEAESM